MGMMKIFARKPKSHKSGQVPTATPRKLFKRGDKGVKNEKPIKGATPPVQLIIGCFEGTDVRKASDAAISLANKFFSQQANGFFGTTKVTMNGTTFIIYEAHEGGTGESYAKSIAEAIRKMNESTLRKSDDSPVDEGNSAIRKPLYIQLQNKILEIAPTRIGFDAYLIPDSESDRYSQSAEIYRYGKLKPLIDQKGRFFTLSAVFFITGMIAMLAVSMYTRYQPYSEPEKKKDVINYLSLPISQLQKLRSLPPDAYVKALRYNNGKWEAPEVVKDLDVTSAPVNKDKKPEEVTQ